MTGKFKPVDPKMDLSSSNKRNIDQKVYWSSEAFNALRKELFTYWNHGDTPGYDNFWYHISGAMVHDPLAFVEYMSAKLGMIHVGFDSWSEEEHCARILDALRVKRGVSKLN